MDLGRDRLERRVGIFGGSFNPIHFGHLRVAEEARQRADLDEMLLVPAGEPPHKRSDAEMAPARDRLAMARLAVAAHPGRLSVSAVEVERVGPSYTVDTLRQLRAAANPATRLFLLIGADTLVELPTWREVRELPRLCRITVLVRPGYPIASTPALERCLGRGEVERILRDSIHVTPQPISSTAVRRACRLGESLRELVPEALERYIRKNKLYDVSGA